MKSFSMLRVVLLLSVVELKAISVSEFSCLKRNLTVTADDLLRLYIDGVEITGLPNAGIAYTPDVVELPCTTRLIAIHGRNDPLRQSGGILASTDDHYILTNSSWKCSNISQSGWEEIGFDDSAWMSAVEYGGNGEPLWVYVPGIKNSSTQWIWLRQWNGLKNSTYEEMDMEVYCRKRLAIDYCESSPCVNGWSCEPIVNGYICQCPSEYTGDHCEYGNTSSTACQPGACISDDIAIAMSALFSVSFAVNITIIIIWRCNIFPAKQDPFKTPENFLPTKVTDLSNVSSTSSPCEELSQIDESQLHQNTDEKLTPTISSNNDQQSPKQN